MRWVKPELVAQIRFVEWTAEGRLMHEAFLGLRTSERARCGEEWARPRMWSVSEGTRPTGPTITGGRIMSTEQANGRKRESADVQIDLGWLVRRKHARQESTND